MAYEVRRVVTGVDADGKSVFIDQGPARRAPAAGLDIDNLWGTGDGIHTLVQGSSEPDLFPFYPAPGATRFTLVHFPPGSAAVEGHEDPEITQPGLLAAFDPDSPGMHTTDSVDYAICLTGELYLELDDGAEEKIVPGTFVVQQGNRHAWHNRGDETCVMAFVLVGAHRA